MQTTLQRGTTLRSAHNNMAPELLHCHVAVPGRWCKRAVRVGPWCLLAHGICLRRQWGVAAASHGRCGGCCCHRALAGPAGACSWQQDTRAIRRRNHKATRRQGHNAPQRATTRHTRTHMLAWNSGACPSSSSITRWSLPAVSMSATRRSAKENNCTAIAINHINHHPSPSIAINCQQYKHKLVIPACCVQSRDTSQSHAGRRRQTIQSPTATATQSSAPGQATQPSPAQRNSAKTRCRSCSDQTRHLAARPHTCERENAAQESK